MLRFAECAASRRGSGDVSRDRMTCWTVPSGHLYVPNTCDAENTGGTG